MSLISVDTKVSWTYQAGGIEFSQKGKVLAYVPAGESAEDALDNVWDDEATTRQKKFSDTSSNDRYLVLVDNNGVPNFYAPTAGVLEKQNQKAVKKSPKPEQVKVASPKVVEKSKGPEIDEIYQSGSSARYRIFAKTKNGSFAGYRLTNGRVKFAIGGRDAVKAKESYASSVRDAQSMYCMPVLVNTEDKVSNLTSVEAASFATSIGKYFDSIGFSGTVETLMKDLQQNATGKGTRRKVEAYFYGKN